MQANELMIDDWVNYKGIYNQIAKSDFDIYREKWIKDLTPIHLTTEILEKNGWRKDGNLFLHPDTSDLALLKNVNHGEHEYNFLMGCFFKEDKDFRWFLDITFVHELQHALRLCGLKNEIKIEDNRFPYKKIDPINIL